MEEHRYHWTDNLLMDPYEEERKAEKWRKKNMPKLIAHLNMTEYVADAQYGIPQKCPCGEFIKTDVSPTPKYKRDFDTQPGARYFTCTKYKDDGLHFRQPWVFGVEEEIEKLHTLVEKQSKTIEEMRMQIQSQAEEIAKLQ